MQNNFLAVQNLKMALKKANISQHTTKSFFVSDTPQRIKRQNKGPKEHDEKYTTLTKVSGQFEDRLRLQTKTNLGWR